VIGALMPRARVKVLEQLVLHPERELYLRELAGRVKAMLVVELSLGQLVEDVRLAVEGRRPVRLLGRTGGVVMTPAEVLEAIRRLAGEMGVG